MTQQIINLGNGPDTATGDSLYVAFTKTNENFTELYGIIGSNSATDLIGNTITANYFVTTGNVRAANVISYGNIETIGNVVGSGFYYANGVSVFSNVPFDSISTNVVPSVDSVLYIGTVEKQWLSAFINSNIVLSGSTITTANGQLYIDGNAVTGTYSNTNVASFLPSYVGNIGAITVIGDLTVPTNLILGGTLVTTANNQLYVNGNLVAGNYGNANVAAYLPTYSGLIGGTLSTGSQPNITSTGTLTSLTVAGNITSGNANILGTLTVPSIVTSGTSGNITGVNYIVANYFQGNGSLLSSLTGSNVSGNVTSAVQSHYANIANSVAGGNVTGQVANSLVAGTVYASAQPNITSTGTLSGLGITGKLNITGNVNVAGN